MTSGERNASPANAQGDGGLGQADLALPQHVGKLAHGMFAHQVRAQVDPVQIRVQEGAAHADQVREAGGKGLADGFRQFVIA